MTTKELLALVACVRESLDGLLYRGKSANATDEDMARDDAYYAVDPALSDLELALPALCAEVEALQAVAEAARRSLSQTAANQRDGLVPTVYYRAHQDLANALAAIDTARSRNEHEG